MDTWSKRIFGGLMALALAGCQLPPLSGAAPASDLVRPEGRFAITGKVEWPQEFETQATLNDVVSAATVSLIDGISNATIATGLTDAGGNFTINPNAAFNPFEGDVFILEAVKGLGNNQPGHSMARLRTLVQRTKDGYDDVDARIGIVITLKTTTVAYAQSRYRLPPNEMIGMVTAEGDYVEKVFYNYPSLEANRLLTRAALNKYHDDVISKALAENRDPMGALYGHYTITTIAGNGLQGWNDGPGSQAMFHTMADLKVRLDGNKPTLLVLDSGNRTVRTVSFVNDDVERGETVVRTILNPLFRNAHTDATASIDPETGEVRGMGVTASLQGVASMDVFAGGQIVFTDPTNHTIRIAYPDKRAVGQRSANGYCLVTVAGVPGAPGSDDGPGVTVDDRVDASYVPSAARFRTPWGITVEKAANGRTKDISEAKIFVADRDNSTMRMLVPRPGPANVFDRMDGVSSALPVYDVYTIAGDPAKGAGAPLEDQEFRYVNHLDAGQARFNRVSQIVHGTPDPLVKGGRQILYITETQTHVVRRIFRKADGSEFDPGGWSVETFAGGQGSDPMAYPDPTSPIPAIQTLGNLSGRQGGSLLGSSTDPFPGALFTNPTNLTVYGNATLVSTSTVIFWLQTKNAAGTAERGPLEQYGTNGSLGRWVNTRGYLDGIHTIAEFQSNPPLAYAPVGKWFYFADRGNYRIRRYQSSL